MGHTEGLCKAPEDSGRAAKRLKKSKGMPIFSSFFYGSQGEFEDHRGMADMGEGICPPHPGFMHGMCIRCGQVQADAQIEGEHLKLRCPVRQHCTQEQVIYDKH